MIVRQRWIPPLCVVNPSPARAWDTSTNDPRETPIGRLVADVPRAIRHPFFGTLQNASETHLRAEPDTRPSF